MAKVCAGGARSARRVRSMDPIRPCGSAADSPERMMRMGMGRGLHAAQMTPIGGNEMQAAKVSPRATVASRAARARPELTHHQAPGAVGAAAVMMSLNDYRRMESLIAARRKAADDAAAIWPMEHKLSRARMFDAKHLPPNVVSIHSCVHLENRTTGRLYTYTLVFPGEANILEGKLSVLSPLGCALLGQSVGDIVAYRAPGGMESVRITRLLFQPESVGEY